MKLLLAPLLLMSACAVVKVPEISSINQDAGKIAVAYDYGLFQKPEVNWGNTLATASAQCKAWQYQEAYQSVIPETTCIQYDQNGRCNSWQVQALYDCKFSAEQAQAYNDKLKEKQGAEQLAKQKALLAKQEALQKLSKEYPLMAYFTCGYSGGTNRYQISSCFLGGGKSAINTQIELRNGQNYGLYEGYDFNKIGKVTTEGLEIPLQSNFEIKAQMTNLSNTQLTLTIKDTATGAVTYVKSVVSYGTINVSN